MSAALGLINALAGTMTPLLTDQVAFSRPGRHVQLVRSRLRAAGGTMAWSQLLRKLDKHMSAAEMGAAIATMVATEEIAVAEVKTRGRSTRIVRFPHQTATPAHQP